MRRNHQSIVKLLLEHKARPPFGQPVRDMPMITYILSCFLFVQISLIVVVVVVFVLCFKKHYMAPARKSLVFTVSVLGSANWCL